MPITHDYLNTTGYKPTASEADVGELVPNLADGTLWSKNVGGTVIEIGGGTETNQNIDAGRADTNYGGTITIECGGA